MGTGEKVKISPEVTGQDDWIAGEVIDVEKNPFNGIVISAKDALGRIFFDKEKYFIPVESV
jgi:hypothetical protein